jgi:PAS domain S-box-containing protein
VSEPDDTALEQSSSFYRHLFDAAPDLLLMIGEEGEVKIANSRCEDVLGHSAEEMKGKRVQDLLMGRHGSVFDVILRGVLEGTPMPEDEVLVQTSGGDAVAMMLDIRPMEGAESSFLLVRLRDLSEIKVLEQEYRNLFESIGDAVFIGDPDSGRIYQANRQAYELTGFAAGELFEEEYDAVHSESWDAISEELEDAGGEELSGREMSLVRKDAGKVPVGIHLRIVERGQERIYIETAFDISERKALEARMRELRAEWDSFVRHELRNPLTPIIAFSQILIEDYDDLQGSVKVPQYLEAIYQGGKKLENLLDMTREV